MKGTELRNKYLKTKKTAEELENTIHSRFIELAEKYPLAVVNINNDPIVVEDILFDNNKFKLDYNVMSSWICEIERWVEKTQNKYVQLNLLEEIKNINNKNKNSDD